MGIKNEVWIYQHQGRDGEKREGKEGGGGIGVRAEQPPFDSHRIQIQFLSPFLRLPLWTQDMAEVSQMKASFRLHLLSTGKPSPAEGLTPRPKRWRFHLLLQPPVQKLSQNGCSIEQRRALHSSPLLDVTTLRSVQRQKDYTEPGQDVFKFHSM